jgi:hypothetical protein
MPDPFLFRGADADRDPCSPLIKTLVRQEVQPDMGQGLTVRQVFAHFQNLNLRVLIDDLRQGQVTRGNWSFADDLCPLAHGMPSGQAVGLLRYLSQAVDLPRACRQAAEELGGSPRYLERFVLSWDCGDMSPEWLLQQLEALWAERLADAEAVQAVLSHGYAAPAAPAIN